MTARIKGVLLRLWDAIPSGKLLFLSCLEIVLTLLIINIPIFLRLIYDAMGKPGTTFTTAVELFWSGYKYGDILGYTAGMLASSTVYFLFNLRLFTSRPGLLLSLTLGPLLVLFFASPVFFRDMTGGVGNATFAASYVQGILALSFLLWLFSAYQQRAIGSGMDLNGDRAVNAIKDKISARR
ncbi:hypothetical protein NFO65_19755 [Neorhizobium galegae]|uniref:hypothetical protein n=1 Tax=Neorhizobium galegae TaxID=399 RepID=UPI002100DE72|nr:hypothetical protein [Neorhizobium galegae]MCQ1572965.1 hypothetical protein [Neorhizobium galegae]